MKRDSALTAHRKYWKKTIKETWTMKMVPALGLPGVEPEMVLNTDKFRQGDRVLITIEKIGKKDVAG